MDHLAYIMFKFSIKVEKMQCFVSPGWSLNVYFNIVPQKVIISLYRFLSKYFFNQILLHNINVKGHIQCRIFYHCESK